MAILLHSASSQKLAGSIHNGFTGMFYLHNPSGRTMSLRVSGVSVHLVYTCIYIHVILYLDKLN